MTTALDDGTLGRLGHLNLMDYARYLTGCAGRQSTIVGDDGLLLCASASAFPVMVNTAWRVDDVPGTEVVDRADRWFGGRGRGYTVYLRDGFEEDADLRAAAESAGLHPLQTPPEMVRRARVEERPLAPGVELRWVADDSSLDDFLAVSDAAYQSLGMPAGVIYETVTDRRRFLAPHVHSVVAYLDGEPVAAAQTLLSHGIAGVYWVGTLESARGAGLGDAVTRAVTNRAFDLGARANTLQASPMGEQIYARMGYETLFRYTGYTRWKPVPAETA